MRLSFLGFLMAALLGGALAAQAGDRPPAGLSLPPMPEAAMADDAPIRISPDGPAVIKLDEDAGSIIIGNPEHATALLESPRLLMLMPAQPGATKIMVLNRDGKTILDRHVVVSSGRPGFKRISRVCATSQASGCQPVSVYYCPDRCYETAVPEEGAALAPTGDVGVPVTDGPVVTDEAPVVPETTSASPAPLEDAPAVDTPAAPMPAPVSATPDEGEPKANPDSGEGADE